MKPRGRVWVLTGSIGGYYMMYDVDSGRSTNYFTAKSPSSIVFLCQNLGGDCVSRHKPGMALTAVSRLTLYFHFFALPASTRQDNK